MPMGQGRRAEEWDRGIEVEKQKAEVTSDKEKFCCRAGLGSFTNAKAESRNDR